jgi:hypothetical protein
MFYITVVSCLQHQNFFDEACEICKKEYFFVKGLEEKDGSLIIDKHVAPRKEKEFFYKEFTEEKAKQLYEKLFLYYLKNLKDEKDASNKAKSIITKQCQIRKIEPWNWI